MRARLRLPLLALLALALGVVGCGQGPGDEEIQKILQERLDKVFEPDLFTVVAAVRNGSFPFQEKDDPTPRLLVYVKARLEFRRDHGLGELGELNAGVLASLVGATPQGITGIVPEGNRKGDQLKVFGSLSLLEKDGRWVPSRRVAPKESQETRRMRAASENETPTERWLAELAEEYRALANKGKREHLRVFEHEVWAARRAVDLQVDRLDGVPSLLAGGESSEYTAIGNRLARAAKARKLAFHSYQSSGSVENCRLVGEGRADFGITQNDIAAMAWYGEDLFEGLRPLKELRAVCSLFPEALQVVTLERSGVKRMADLRGKRVAIGPPGSGTRVNALEVLEAHGLSAGSLAARLERSFGDSLEALRAGEVDAVFMTMAYPAYPIEELAGSHELALISLDEAAIAGLVAERPFLTRMVIPPRTYIDQPEAVTTLGMTALVVTHKDTSPSKVKTVLDLVFGSRKALEREQGRSPVRPLRPHDRPEEGSRVASFLTRKTAALGISIPPHPTAAEALDLAVEP